MIPADTNSVLCRSLYCVGEVRENKAGLLISVYVVGRENVVCDSDTAVCVFRRSDAIFWAFVFLCLAMPIAQVTLLTLRLSRG